MALSFIIISRFITHKLISYRRLIRTLTKKHQYMKHWGNRSILALKTPTFYQMNSICRPQDKTELVTIAPGNRGLYLFPKLPLDKGGFCFPMDVYIKTCVTEDHDRKNTIRMVHRHEKDLKSNSGWNSAPSISFISSHVMRTLN